MEREISESGLSIDVSKIDSEEIDAYFKEVHNLENQLREEMYANYQQIHLEAQEFNDPLVSQEDLYQKREELASRYQESSDDTRDKFLDQKRQLLESLAE